MNPKDPLSSFLESPYLRETLLRIPERELISTILRHAEDCGHTPESKRCLEEVLSRAVGEIILQRAAENLGTHVLAEIRRQSHASRGAKSEPGISAGPPTPAPSPRPPAPAPAPAPHGALRMHADITAGPPPSPAPGPHPPAPSPTGPHHAFPSVDAATLPAHLALDASCVVLDEFLAPAELQELTNFALEHESEFRTSEVISPGRGGGVIDPEHRRSRVLMNLGRFDDLIFQRIQSALPLVLDKLGMARFRIRRFESQITASNHGDFFRNHSDSGEQETASRRLTFVYFFHREPKAFQGGELRVHDSPIDNGTWLRTENGKTVIPEQNQMVFFRSDLLHEITPVVCPSQAFADSRFTVNGWLHR